MLIGLLSDIHEDIERLTLALDALRAARCDRLIMLGDVYDTGDRVAEACRVLAAAEIPGVWGNHDFGLCADVAEDIAATLDAGVLAYMATLRPRIMIGDCLFQHVEPWLDPTQVENLWQHFGPADSVTRIERALQESPRRVSFMGHLHEWLIANTEGPVLIGEPRPTMLALDRRWLVAVGAVCDGWAATYRSDSGLLTPVHLG